MKNNIEEPGDILNIFRNAIYNYDPITELPYWNSLSKAPFNRIKHATIVSCGEMIIEAKNGIRMKVVVEYDFIPKRLRN